MNGLKLDKELLDIVKEEAKNLSEDVNYDKYQIHEEFKPKISKNFSQNEVALTAIEDTNKIGNIIQRIVINVSDKEKRGRDIKSNINYAHIRFCKSKEDSIIFFLKRKKQKG